LRGCERGPEPFETRCPLSAWLCRIAAGDRLNALREGRRRPREAAPREPGSAPPAPSEPIRRAEPLWLEPYPNVLIDELPALAPGPEARYEPKESLGLAFVAALQRIPPRQRAVLVLRDVLGFRASEVAVMLVTSEVSVEAALQHARATLESSLPDAGREHAPALAPRRERELMGRFADAFESADIERLIALLTEDATLTLPPEPLEYQGHAAIAGYFVDRSWWSAGATRLVPTRANNQPAFGYYLRDPRAQIAHAHGLVVLTLEGEKISAITRFGDNSLLPHFGLPRTLRD
jgi:RNA polymerase sigma-70 factor (ECF subfamily)